MKKNINGFLFFCAAAILFSSCGKNNEAGKMIPHNALFVAQADMNTLSKKLSWQEIRETGWFKKAAGDSSKEEWQRKLLDNPETSGISFDKDLVFFVTKGEGDQLYLVLQGSLKNENDFTQFNKKFAPSQAIQKNGDISILTLKDKSVAGWNGDHFAYVISGGSTPAELPDWRPAGYRQTQYTEENAAKLATFCASLFSLKADSSLAKNDKFSDLLKDNGDIHFWQNTEAVMKSAPDLGMLGMLKLDIFFKGNYSATTARFSDGKIELDQKLYTGKELTDFIKKYRGSKINTDMIARIPSGNVLGIFAANFKPEGIQELIRLTGTDGFINMYLQQVGLSLDDFSKANNGDILFSFSDVTVKADSISIEDAEGNVMDRQGISKPDFNLLFSMSVRDKASFQKIADAVKKMSSSAGEDTPFSLLTNDKYFALGNHSSFVNQYLAGEAHQFDFLDKLKGKPMGAFIDLQKILKATSSARLPDTAYQSMMDRSLQIWDKIFMTAGDIKGDALTAHTEVTLIDQKTNSLKQLNTYFNDMYQLNELNQQRNPSLRNLDSLLTPPPMDTVKVP